MFDIKKLRQEFADLHAQTETLVNYQKDRDLTPDEQSTKAKNFKRMETIQKEIESHLDGVKQYAESHMDELTDPYRNLPHDAREADQFEGRELTDNGYIPTDRTPRVLFKGTSARKALAPRNSGITLNQFMRATVFGAKNQAERNALANAGGATNLFEMPTDLSTGILDASRAASIFNQAGVGFLPQFTAANRAMVESTEPSATFRTEGYSVATTQSFTGQVVVPHTLAALVTVPRELIEDSINPSALEDSMGRVIGQTLDLAIGYGTAGGPNGILAGVGNTIAATNANGDQLTDYSQILNAYTTVQTNGYTPSAVVLSPRELGTLSGLIDTLHQPLRKPEPLNSLPFLACRKAPLTQTQGTSHNASSIIVGDFSKVIVSIRHPLQFELFREPFATTLQYGFLMWLRLDVIVTNPKALCSITGIVVPEGS